MSSSSSPSHYTEDAFINDANFKVEINQKMKVPDKISFSTDTLNQNGWLKDNIDMQVPERILVAGQHQHIGTRAPPREIIFDNSLIVTDPYPNDVRVATPPRTLTLDKYPFPGLEELDEPEIVDQLPVAKIHKQPHNDSDFIDLSRKELSPARGGGGLNEKLTPAEEILHLRRQMAKLNRRVMALEVETLNRSQKEKFIVGFGVAYVLLKLIIWLNRD